MRSCASIVQVFHGSVCSAVAMGGGQPLSRFDELLLNGSSDRILLDTADGRLVAYAVEWLISKALPDVMFKLADKKSSSIRPII